MMKTPEMLIKRNADTPGQYCTELHWSAGYIAETLLKRYENGKKRFLTIYDGLTDSRRFSVTKKVDVVDICLSQSLNSRLSGAVQINDIHSNSERLTGMCEKIEEQFKQAPFDKIERGFWTLKQDAFSRIIIFFQTHKIDGEIVDNARGFKLATGTKILHLKFPELTPVLDSYVQKYYDYDENRGDPVHLLEAMTADIKQDGMVEKLIKISDGIYKRSGIRLPTIRVLDLLLWDYINCIVIHPEPKSLPLTRLDSDLYEELNIVIERNDRTYSPLRSLRVTNDLENSHGKAMKFDRQHGQRAGWFRDLIKNDLMVYE